MSWEFENTQTDRVSDSELKGKGVRPIPATELGCKNRVCAAQGGAGPSRISGFPLFLLTLLVRQGPFGPEQEEGPQELHSRNVLIADGSGTAGSGPLPVSVTWINFCKDVLQPQS